MQLRAALPRAAAPLAQRPRRRRTAAACSTSNDVSAATLEKLRTGLGQPGGLPFLLDAELLSPDVRYDGPLCELRGAQAYSDAHREWSTSLPTRLAGFTVSSPTLVGSLVPGQRTLLLRWRARFAAPLPPRALERLRAAGEPTPPLTPDGALEASLSLSSELELGEDGRLVRHSERVVSGFDVVSTIARFEYMTARRRADPPPLWYVRVLRDTSVAEAAAASGGSMDEASLQAGFLGMIAANLGKGMLLGCGIYVALKLLLLFARGGLAH